MLKPVIAVSFLFAAASPAAAVGCRLLIVNDDGVGAPGIAALADALRADCEVVVSAPAGEQSGASHAIPNVRDGLRVRSVAVGSGTGYAVEGSPAEAAGLGLTALSDGRRFDLVVSGINRGENTGLANLYSGTVNAAVEALVRGVPAIAISQDMGYGRDYAASAEIARKLVRKTLAKRLPEGVMLNVNIPMNPKGVTIAPASGMTVRIAGFDATDAGEGVTLYRARIAEETAPPAAGDVAAYRAGRITITPLALDRTDRAALRAVRWAAHAGF